MACSTEGIRSSANIKATDTVPLNDNANVMLAQVIFKGPPSSAQDPSATNISDVPFAIVFSLYNLPLGSLQAIAGGDQQTPVFISLTFTMTNDSPKPSIDFFVQMYKSEIGAPKTVEIVQGKPLSFPFPTGKISLIDLKINGSIVASYNPNG